LDGDVSLDVDGDDARRGWSHPKAIPVAFYPFRAPLSADLWLFISFFGLLLYSKIKSEGLFIVGFISRGICSRQERGERSHEALDGLHYMVLK
jgi:hypothetical protein